VAGATVNTYCSSAVAIPTSRVSTAVASVVACVTSAAAKTPAFSQHDLSQLFATHFDLRGARQILGGLVEVEAIIVQPAGHLLESKAGASESSPHHEDLEALIGTLRISLARWG
jgi:ABC-type Fe2+-enterobactin transport system substrate-binding protein